MRLLIGSLSVLLVLANHLFAQQGSGLIYYSPQKVLDFADYLYKQEEYLRAAAEYERFRFLSHSDSDSIAFRIGLCYSRAGQMDKALHYLGKFVHQRNQSVYWPDAVFYLSYSHYTVGQYDPCIQLLAQNYEYFENPYHRDRALFLLTASYLMTQQWTVAEASLNRREEIESPFYNWDKLESQTLLGRKLPRKSPIVAGTLSAVVPGLGKFYVGRPIDGLFSFVLIALTGWQAYDGFSEKGTKSFKGWFYGALSSAFYLGNVYGSAVAAKIVYQQSLYVFKREVQIEVKTAIGY